MAPVHSPRPAAKASARVQVFRGVLLALTGGWAIAVALFGSVTLAGVAPLAVLLTGALLTHTFDRAALAGQARLEQALARAQRSEEARARSEASLRLVLDTAPDLIVFHRDRRFIYANAAMARALGLADSTALLGTLISDWTHPEEQARLAERHRAYAAGEPQRPQDFRLRRADGTWLHAEFNSIHSEYGGAPALLAMGRDLTERDGYDARLKLADRLASIGTLAAGMAHELNNPLAFITSNLAYVRGALASGESPRDEARAEWRQALTEAEDGARRMKRIIQDLHLYADAAPSQLQEVELATVVQSALRLAETELRHGLRVTVALAPGVRVYGDEAKLAQVLLHLLVNAAQALPPGTKEPQALRVISRVEGQRVHLSVQDTGCGIPRELLPRVFDPFFTTRKIGSGMGLGLFICHNLVEAMGGEISVQSEQGQGSTFTVTLPISALLRTADRSADPVAAAPRPRILVVDDEPLVGRGLRRTLSGHEVTLSTSGEHALSLVRSGARFDAILCDLMMPEMDGAAFYDAVFAESPEHAARILFITAGAFTADAQAFLQTGKAWLQKPYEVAALRSAIDAVVTGARVRAA